MTKHGLAMLLTYVGSIATFLGGCTLIVALTMATSGEPTCDHKEMAPGSVCKTKQYGSVVRTTTYDEMKAYQPSVWKTRAIALSIVVAGTATAVAGSRLNRQAEKTQKAAIDNDAMM